MKDDLLLAYYGDDFTGSTDALEFISRAGMNAALFIDPPTEHQLKKYSYLHAIGVAGFSRSLSPSEMEKELGHAFEQLNLLNPKHVHYKVCSTFDSSPGVGSIGKAIDIGAAIFRNEFTPLLVAAPALGRYSVFGNLFARMGIGTNGDVYRLDRHPSMSKHPVTPSDESDLRLQLARQTGKTIGLLDILQLNQGRNYCIKILNKLREKKTDIVMIDALHQDQLELIGELLETVANNNCSLFSVGSSGIEMALGKYWNTQGIIQPKNTWQQPIEVSRLLVLSGSCSPVTASQIKWARENGFKEMEIDAGAVANRNMSDLFEIYCSQAVDYLTKNYSVIIHTGGIYQKKVQNKDSAKLLGSFLGLLGREICKQSNIVRLIIAGGDTSSYAARALGIESVEMIAPLIPGAPLCKAFAPGSPVNNIEVNFKGGQVGPEDYFGIMKQGNLNAALHVDSSSKVIGLNKK